MDIYAVFIRKNTPSMLRTIQSLRKKHKINIRLHLYKLVKSKEKYYWEYQYKNINRCGISQDKQRSKAKKFKIHNINFIYADTKKRKIFKNKTKINHLIPFEDGDI